MEIKAIIFDMDGLLIDSEPVWNEARKQMAAEKGINWTVDDHHNVMGVSTEEWTDYMIERLSLDISPAEVQERIIGAMEDLYRQRIPFFDGAVELIRWANANFPTAVASGSPRRLIDAVTGAPELEGMFNLTLAADEVGKGKPDPAVYLETARFLEIDPQNCVVLEDSGNGVLSGVRAGMYTINVPDDRFPPSPEKQKEAHKVCVDLATALTHLQDLSK
ncbi:MAG: HAD family phosphatase [Chloroflexota bacterium]